MPNHIKNELMTMAQEYYNHPDEHSRNNFSFLLAKYILLSDRCMSNNKVSKFSECPDLEKESSLKQRIIVRHEIESGSDGYMQMIDFFKKYTKPSVSSIQRLCRDDDVFKKFSDFRRGKWYVHELKAIEFFKRDRIYKKFFE